MTDDELTNAWQTGKVFPGGISHEQHLRIAWVLQRRHGADCAEDLLVSGTRLACQVHGCPEKFDEALTRGWARALAEAVARDGFGPSARAFLDAHRELMQGDLLSDSMKPKAGRSG